MLFEHPDEMRVVVETDQLAGFLHALPVPQQFTGSFDPVNNNVISDGKARCALEDLAEAGFADKEAVGEIIQRQIFRIVLADETQDVIDARFTRLRFGDIRLIAVPDRVCHGKQELVEADIPLDVRAEIVLQGFGKRGKAESRCRCSLVKWITYRS